MTFSVHVCFFKKTYIMNITLKFTNLKLEKSINNA